MTGYLRQEDYQFIRNNIIEANLDELVARRIIPKDPSIGKGAQEAKRWNYNEPDEDADILSKGQPYPEITATMSPTTVPIHKIGAATKFDEWDLESSRSQGAYAVDKRVPRSLGRKMAEKEDAYIFNGNSEVNVTGLYDLATNDKSCTTKWDASGGEPYEDINAAAGLLEADGFSAKYLVMNKNDISLLRQEDAYGNVYMDKVLKNLSLTRENILKTATLTKGTALLCDSSSEIAELKIAEELTVLPPEYIEDTCKIRARAKIGMDVYQTDAFCTISNIS